MYANRVGRVSSADLSNQSSTQASEQTESHSDETASTEDASHSESVDSVTQGPKDQIAQNGSSSEEITNETIGVSDQQPAEMDVSSVAYVYVDQGVIAIGDTQYIAIGFNDLDGSLSTAQITLGGTQHESISVSASKVIDDAALFEVSFSDDSQADAYTVSDVAFTLQNYETSYVVQFSDDANANNDYSFEVVTADVANALSESGTEDGVTAMTVGEDGELAAAESVEDAIETADASGVQESQDNATAPSVSSSRSRSAVSATREDYLIVAIDPGHGGSDVGAVGNGLQEASVNWGISQNLRTSLTLIRGSPPILLDRKTSA